MKKLSAEQINHVFGQVPETLRKLASERDFWKNEAQTRIRHEECAKVAQAMHEKGISLEVPLADLTSNLEKAAEAGKLEKIAEAVDMVGPNMGQKIASLTTDEGHAQGASSSLEQFILGGIG